MMEHDLWDDMASDYDESVENNQDPIIAEYLTREMEILSTICEKICQPNKNCSVIDMGAGTGRVIFALAEMINHNSLQFCGIEISEPMIKHANQKNQDHHRNQNIQFLKHDLTDPNLSAYFESKTVNIVMCLYNTLGVVPADKRQRFVDNMIKIAGHDGLVVISVFNGDNFGFVAPRLYHPMMPMIRRIEDNSFDEKNKVFQNSLGFHSQWFTSAELKSMLHSDTDPIPIRVVIDNKSHTFGNVFVNKKLM